MSPEKEAGIKKKNGVPWLGGDTIVVALAQGPGMSKGIPKSCIEWKW